MHIHTPGTKMSNAFGGTTKDVWDRYIDILETAPPAVYGLTDYFSCDTSFSLIEKYRTRYPSTEKVFFINVELRLSEAIDAENKSPHLHIIFDNDERQCSSAQIQKFLMNLSTNRTNKAGAHIMCGELATEQDFESASVSFKDVRRALEMVFGDHTPFLLFFPAKNDGVKSADKGSPRKMALTEEIDKGCHAFFGDSDSAVHFLRTDRYTSGSDPKPVVSGSDAHSFADLDRLDGNVAYCPPTWIKADLTFRGLKQICFEPEARVFIGDEPPVEKRKASQPTKILSKLHIRQVDGYNGSKGHWFKNVEIPLNPELTAIIGNKGSGKSALVDILGLLGESRQEAYFGFLTDSSRNKKFRQKGFAESFQVEITWHSNSTNAKNLSNSVDLTKPETVRYLPQNYFEQLTNEIEISKFRKEIEDVVFSHVEETEKMEMNSFKELQDLKTLQSRDETSVLKGRVRQLNNDIVALEARADPQHLKVLLSQLASKQDELRAHEAAKPLDVPKPAEETPEQKIQAQFIEERSATLEALRVAEQGAIDAVSHMKNRHQRLRALKDSVENLKLTGSSGKEALRDTSQALGLDIDAIVAIEIDTAPIDALIVQVLADIAVLDGAVDSILDYKTDFTNLKSLSNIRAAIEFHLTWIEELRDLLSTPQRKYQAYLEKLTGWNSQKAAIAGSVDDPAPETINFLQHQIEFVKNDLSAQILVARAARKELSERIFTSKKKILQFYSDIKASVEAKLADVSTNEFSVQIKAAFLPNREFIDEFLSLVNKARRGPFHGAKSPEIALKTLVGEIDWNDFSSIDKFCENVITAMKGHDDNGPYLFEVQVNPKTFYDFLFSLEYFSASYELRLGNKNLDELSPGEKGLLLLVFYLQLDKDNIPLIIDQPEDNLDNESIFSILANCIRHAKKTRQVVLVTHNPNLAVGADAEQIIYVKLDKARNYKFSYESGAIEDPAINQRIVDVLEGSQPAFVKRRLKYQIA